MILVVGSPSEGPLASALAALERRRAPVRLLDQRRASHWASELSIVDGNLSGYIFDLGDRIPISEHSAIYQRMCDPRGLKIFAGLPAHSQAVQTLLDTHLTLETLLDSSPALVVNRPRACASNAWKPYQQERIRAAGFEFPETLITNHPELVMELRARCGRLIFKSASGVRSIVRELTDADLRRIDSIRGCPTMFQELVPGQDLRIHVVGDEVFTTKVVSRATDYRYPGVDGDTKLSATTTSPELESRCIELARALDLSLAGVDLRITPQGRVFCFEVNPCPAFNYYENATGQPISTALAELLHRRERRS